MPKKKKDSDKTPKVIKSDLGGKKLPENVPPRIRKAYKERFEEAQLEEIGKEASKERQMQLEELPEATDPEAIKNVQGETGVLKSERPLTPKPKPLEPPTPGQLVRKQKGRLPRGAGRPGVFTFQESRGEESPFTIKNIRDVVRQTVAGKDISPLPPHVQGTALALARRDHELAKSTGKPVNDIDPNSEAPDQYSIRGKHHERLAEVIHGYGVKESDINKIPGKGNAVDKTHFAWSALKEHERSKRKIPLWPEHEGATHWQDPRSKRISPLSKGNHPEFYRHAGETQSLIRATGEAAWRPVTPVTQGWDVVNLRGQKTWVFRDHPASQFKNTHQVRSLFQHIQNTLKGDFPEAPIATEKASEMSRKQTAQRVREKLVDPYSVAAKQGVLSGYRRQRGRAEKTFVGEPDNITVTQTPETEFVVTTPGSPEKRKPKAPKRYLLQKSIVPPAKSDKTKAAEMGNLAELDERVKQAMKLPEGHKEEITTKKGKTIIRSREDIIRGAKLTRDVEGERIAKERQSAGVGQQMAKLAAPDVTKIGPSGEILRSKPTIQKGARVEVKKRLMSRTDIKIVPTYKVTPGPVDQPLPGMENITAPKVSEPKPQPAFAGETGMEQLKFYKEQHGGVIPSQSKEIAIRGKVGKRAQRRAEGRKPRVSPTQLRPKIEEPLQQQLPFKGDMGPQWVKITNPVTKELQEKAQQGAVPGVAADMPRGIAKKKSTRSFKGRR